jgi:hypothetical protein
VSSRRINTCRFCGKSAHADWLVKYGTRHYAHPSCYLNAGKAITDLPQYEQGQFERKQRDWVELQTRVLK